MAENQLSTSALPFRNFFINSYILPGFLFVTTTILICIVFRNELPNWTYFQNTDFNENLNNGVFLSFMTEEFSFFTQILFLLIALFVSIIVGNAISVLSSLIFDLIWFGKGIGWPYERILSYYPKKYISRAINVSLITAFHVVCVLYIYDFIKSIRIGCWLIIIIFLAKDGLKNIYTKLVLKASDNEIREFLKSITIDRRNRLFETVWLIHRFLFFKSTKSKSVKWFIYIFSFLWFLDISVALAIILGKFFGISHGLDKHSRKTFKNKLSSCNKENPFKNDTNVYWTAYITMVNKNPENMRIANSHLKRSILIRNLAMVGVLVLFILINLKPETETEIFLRWSVWSKVWWVSTFLLFIGYNIIVYKYYTKYLIRCFILEESIQPSS